MLDSFEYYASLPMLYRFVHRLRDLSNLPSLNPTSLAACEVPAEPRFGEREAGAGALDLDLRPDSGRHREAAREGVRNALRLAQGGQE